MRDVATLARLNLFNMPYQVSQNNDFLLKIVQGKAA